MICFIPFFSVDIFKVSLFNNFHYTSRIVYPKLSKLLKSIKKYLYSHFQTVLIPVSQADQIYCRNEININTANQQYIL